MSFVHIYTPVPRGLKCMIVYLARDIPMFVMYCVYGKSCSSLLIESTDSMIVYTSTSPQLERGTLGLHLSRGKHFSGY